MDCGPTCLRMIARFYGRVYSIQNLREKASSPGKESPCWVSARRRKRSGSEHRRADHGGGIGKGMSPTLHTALEPMAFRGLLQDKEREVLHSGPGGGTYHLYEGGVQAVLGQAPRWTDRIPGRRSCWNRGRSSYGMEDEGRDRKRNLGFFSDIYRPTGGRWHSSCWGMVTASVLQLILPFLTQSLVDTGIRDNQT